MKRLEGSQSCSGYFEEQIISCPLLEFEPQIVQAVAL